MFWLFLMLWSPFPVISCYSLAKKSTFPSFLLYIIWVGPKPFHKLFFLIGVPFPSTLTNYTTPLLSHIFLWYFVCVHKYLDWIKDLGWIKEKNAFQSLFYNKPLQSNAHSLQYNRVCEFYNLFCSNYNTSNFFMSLFTPLFHT